MKKIIISRTDNIGDVVLTLPLAGYLKLIYPLIKVYFLGKKYTAPVIETSNNVDFFLDREEVLRNENILKEINADAIIFVYPDKQIAKASFKAHIPLRIGTSHRIFHWLFLNKLIHFSRRKSSSHESILNFKLLTPLQLSYKPSLIEIPSLYGMDKIQPLNNELKKYFKKEKINILLHPKSKGSAREWPISSYIDLIKKLPSDKYHFIVTGTAAEGDAVKMLHTEIFDLVNVLDLTGKLSLIELISVIKNAQGLVACSTGPLHIAAAIGIAAFGIYPPIKPMNAERWGAIGNKVKLFYLKKECSDCRISNICACIENISVDEIMESIKETYA